MTRWIAVLGSRAASLSGAALATLSIASCASRVSVFADDGPRLDAADLVDRATPDGAEGSTVGSEAGGSEAGCALANGASRLRIVEAPIVLSARAGESFVAPESRQRVRLENLRVSAVEPRDARPDPIGWSVAYVNPAHELVLARYTGSRTERGGFLRRITFGFPGPPFVARAVEDLDALEFQDRVALTSTSAAAANPRAYGLQTAVVDVGSETLMVRTVLPTLTERDDVDRSPAALLRWAASAYGQVAFTTSAPTGSPPGLTSFDVNLSGSSTTPTFSTTTSGGFGLRAFAPTTRRDRAYFGLLENWDFPANPRVLTVAGLPGSEAPDGVFGPLGSGVGCEGTDFDLAMTGTHLGLVVECADGTARFVSASAPQAGQPFVLRMQQTIAAHNTRVRAHVATDGGSFVVAVLATDGLVPELYQYSLEGDFVTSARPTPPSVPMQAIQMHLAGDPVYGGYAVAWTGGDPEAGAAPSTVDTFFVRTDRCTGGGS